jgi:hypothetical protein
MLLGDLDKDTATKTAWRRYLARLNFLMFLLWEWKNLFPSVSIKTEEEEERRLFYVLTRAEISI